MVLKMKEKYTMGQLHKGHYMGRLGNHMNKDVIHQFDQQAFNAVASNKFMETLGKIDTKLNQGVNYPVYNDTTKVQQQKSIYLAGGFFSAVQDHDLLMASSILSENNSVGHVHIPIMHQYKDATVDDPKGVYGGFMWSKATFQADKTAMDLSDLGVVLWNSVEEDSGTAWEQGYLTGIHKPVVLVCVNADQKPVNLMNAMGLTVYVDSWEALAKLNFNELMPEFYTGDVI